jgi:hypothetical protein
MTIAIVVIALIVITMLLFILKSRETNIEKIGPGVRPRPAAPQPLTDTAAFHAVSIKYLSSACPAAKTMDGKRFLATAAPRLPLPDCDVLKCRCKFVHHKDRRSSEDRRNPFQGPLSQSTTGNFQVDQRILDERRENPPHRL